MGKRVRLWVDREDGQEPKAVARDAVSPPGPGRLVDVFANSAKDARAFYAIAQRPEPDRRTDKQGWVEWDDARDRVREVSA